MDNKYFFWTWFKRNSRKMINAEIEVTLALQNVQKIIAFLLSEKKAGFPGCTLMIFSSLANPLHVPGNNYRIIDVLNSLLLFDQKITWFVSTFIKRKCHDSKS